jgi:CBS domain-containing protein
MQIDELPLTNANYLAVTNPDETISKVALIITERNIGALPVCDKSGKLVGIISERDIVHGFSEKGADLNELKVSDLMTSNVISCHPGDDVNEIMEVMNKHGIRHVPVLDGDKLFSIVSSRDVMSAILMETKANFQTMGLAYETVR